MWKRIKINVKYFLFKTYSIQKCSDIPEKINGRVIYLIDDWAIVFKCPCKCGRDIHLNTLPECSPKWVYQIKKRNINIAPSINRKRGCKSHFWIKTGKIFWC